MIHCSTAFKINSGTRINRIYETLPDGKRTWNQLDTISVSSVNSDTLVEIDATLPSASLFYWDTYFTNEPNFPKWTTPIIPVWQAHSVDLTNEGILGSRVTDGKYEVTWYGGWNLKWFTFRQDVGLLNYYQRDTQAIPGAPSIDITLLSFTTNQINNSIHHLHCAPLKASSVYHAVTNLSLPHISISTRENVFDLMGRSFPAEITQQNNIKNRRMIYR